jgi:hypothetical protein
MAGGRALTRRLGARRRTSCVQSGGNRTALPEIFCASAIRADRSKLTEAPREDAVAFIVNFTPTGLIPTKQMTPHVPISVNEIVGEVHRAVELGITMVHLHTRDEKTGAPTHSAATYARIISGIRKSDQDF